MENSKITMQSARIDKVLAKNIPHPFSCYPSTTQLNPDAFICIKGEGPYEEYSWDCYGNDFGVDEEWWESPDYFDCLWKSNVYFDLYENDDSITVVLPDICRGYRCPKEYFTLTVSQQFELKVERHIKQSELMEKIRVLKEKKYPKEIFFL